MTLMIAALGWVIWLYGLIAESDTGHPDGVACTGRTGDAYDACLRQSEIGGLVSWALTLGIAGFGLSALLRSRGDRRVGVTQWVFTGLAVLASGSLLVAGIVVWVNGARGAYYDDLLGPLWWNLAMMIGLVGGALLGRRLPVRTGPSDDEASVLQQPAPPEP